MGVRQWKCVMCLQWQQGFCLLGDACDDLHGEEDRSPAPAGAVPFVAGSLVPPGQKRGFPSWSDAAAATAAEPAAKVHRSAASAAGLTPPTSLGGPIAPAGAAAAFVPPGGGPAFGGPGLRPTAVAGGLGMVSPASVRGLAPRRPNVVPRLVPQGARPVRGPLGMVPAGAGPRPLRPTLGAKAPTQAEMFDAIWRRYSEGEDRIYKDGIFRHARETNPQDAPPAAWFTPAQYAIICNDLGTTPAAGINRQTLMKWYLRPGGGVLLKDYNTLFRSGATAPGA